MPAGWEFVEAGTNANTTYAADDGTLTAGNTYSYGATGNSERAFGTLQSGTNTPTIGASFTNNTGDTIASLDVSYIGEQWRLGTTGRMVPDRLDFQYSLNATSLTTGTWTDVNALDFSTPNPTAAVGKLDGNLVANRTPLNSTITGLSIANGATFYIRWASFDASGSDDGLAVDDVALTPHGPSATPALSINDVTQSEGNAGPTTFTFTVSLDQPAAAGGVTFDIATADGTATDGVGEVETDYAPKGFATQTIPQNSSQYQFTVDVNGDTTVEANETFFVNVTNVTGATVSDGQGLGTITNDDVTLTLIHDIQGATHISPMDGTSRSVRGIVTARRSNGFYVQEEDSDNDSDIATSEGIFVFTSSSPPATVVVGNDVTVTGTVSEFRAASTSLTNTELVGPLTIVVNSMGNGLPTPVVIGTANRIPPNMVIEDDATGSPSDVEDAGALFDPSQDGIDFYESLEGMYVQVNDAVAVGRTADFGAGGGRELPVLGDNGANASVRTARDGIVIRANDFNPERIILHDAALGASLPLASVKDTFPGAILGVMDYSFGNFKLEATSMPSLVSGALTQEVAATPTANQLSIATFNVENLSPADGATKFNTLAGLIVNNLKAPDLIALEEIQDDSGPTDNGVVTAANTYNMLITAINNVDNTLNYAFTQIDPVNDSDGGQLGGNIRVGFLYRTDRGLAFVSKPGAGSTTPNQVQAPTMSSGVLVYSPGRIDPANGAFTTSRKPLAAEFTFNGQRFYAIANHWNSKGGDQPLFGHFQPPTLSSEVQRVQQAQVVNQFVDDMLGQDPTAQIVVLGDFNDFEFSNPLLTVTDNGTVLHDLYFQLPQPERYSYVFDGNSQALDHILVSTPVLSRAPDYDVVHVNSEFANRVSDHEPQVLKYDPQSQPTAAEVAKFTAQRTKAAVLVRWRTANESRVAGFNLYRERAGKLVKLNGKLIRARASGTARGGTYSWRDALAKPGAHYRLQIVRLDGTRAWRGSARS